MAYDHAKVEKKWQHYWEENKTFRTSDKTEKEKYYVLDMFPYPSGQGLHVGHPEGYTATDIMAHISPTEHASMEDYLGCKVKTSFIQLVGMLLDFQLNNMQ